MKRIIFVYNTDSKLINKIFNLNKKCNFYKLTHKKFKFNRDFKEFLEKPKTKEFEFLFSNKFEKKYKQFYILPMICTIERENLKVLVSPEEINNCKTTKQIINLIKKSI